MKTPKCNKCSKIYNYSEITQSSNYAFVYKYKNKTIMIGKKCFKCKLELQRNHRKKTNNFCYKKYEKTKSGFLMRVYRNMLSRTKGLTKPHLYLGKKILAKNDFYKWSKNNIDFINLFNSWEKSGYNRKLTPSIDRIDSSKDYLFPNIRWVTFSENCRIGALSKNNKNYSREN